MLLCFAIGSDGWSVSVGSDKFEGIEFREAAEVYVVVSGREGISKNVLTLTVWPILCPAKEMREANEVVPRFLMVIIHP